MKYFVEGRERKIYFTKDNTAFYKSKGNNVDVTYMFKKTKKGLELRKKYLKTGGEPPDDDNDDKNANDKNANDDNGDNADNSANDDKRVKPPSMIQRTMQKASELYRNFKEKHTESGREEKEYRELTERVRARKERDANTLKERRIAADNLKQKLIQEIPSYFDKLKTAISQIDEELINHYRRLFEMMQEDPYNIHKDFIYEELKDKSLELANILNNIAYDIAETDENLKLLSDGKGEGEYTFYYDKDEGYGGFKPIKLDIKSEDFEDIFVKVAWRYLGAKSNKFIGKTDHSHPHDTKQAINNRIYMINALKQAEKGVDVEVPTEEEVAAKEAERKKYSEQQRIANEEEDAMRKAMVGTGTGMGYFDDFTNLKRDRGVSLKGVYDGGYKKSNKKSNKKSDKNTDSKSTKKASKKTKK